MLAGLGVVVGKFGQILAGMGKSGQVWMGQTDLAGMDDMDSGWVWVYVQVQGLLWVGVGGCTV